MTHMRRKFYDLVEAIARPLLLRSWSVSGNCTPSRRRSAVVLRDQVVRLVS